MSVNFLGTVFDLYAGVWLDDWGIVLRRHTFLPEAGSPWTKFGRTQSDGREWANAEAIQSGDGVERHLSTQG
jgi:hypothetical protein